MHVSVSPSSLFVLVRISTSLLLMSDFDKLAAHVEQLHNIVFSHVFALPEGSPEKVSLQAELDAKILPFLPTFDSMMLKGKLAKIRGSCVVTKVCIGKAMKAMKAMTATQAMVAKPKKIMAAKKPAMKTVAAMKVMKTRKVFKVTTTMKAMKTKKAMKAKK